MKKITAIINQKGGVGKTTTAINLSCGLALKNQKVLLIDLDPQAHSSIGLGFEPDKYEHAIDEVLTKKNNIENVIKKTEIENLHLAPSHIRLDKTETSLISAINRERILKKAIKNLTYDYIIIDCRPTLNTLTLNALDACQLILVPCDMSRYALDGFADLLDTVEDVKNDGFDIKKNLRILLTRFDGRKEIAEWLLNELEPHKHRLLKTRIRQNEDLNKAHVHQQPIFLFNKNCNGTIDYKLLTSEFLELWQQKN